MHNGLKDTWFVQKNLVRGKVGCSSIIIKIILDLVCIIQIIDVTVAWTVVEIIDKVKVC